MALTIEQLYDLGTDHNPQYFAPHQPQTTPPTMEQSAANNAMLQANNAEQAKFEQAQMEQAQKAEQAQRAKQAEKWVINAMVPKVSQEGLLRLNSQINGYKAGYEQAAKAGDMETAQMYADQANALRQHLAKQGITGIFGADEYNAAQGNAVLQAQQSMAMQNFFDMESPTEVYNRKIRDYLQRGYNENDSKTLAARDADEYQAKWERQALGAAYNYGVGNNVINNNGMRILSTLSGYNPQAAAIGFKSYGLPIDEYNHLWGERNANTAANIANEQLGLKHNYGIEDMLTQGGIKENLIRAQNDANIQAQNNATDNAIRQMGAQFGFNQQQQEWLLNTYHENPEAFMAIFGSKGGSDSKGNSGGDKKKLSAAEEKIKNTIVNILKDVDAKLEDDDLDSDEDMQAILDFEQYIKDGKVKGLDPDTVRDLEVQLAQKKDAWSVKHGHKWGT